MSTNNRGAAAMLAIFGGTFDPIHFGHLRAAVEALESLRLDRLFLLPAGNPPHRTGTFASAEHRQAMLQLAVKDYPDLPVDPREVRREGYSWMVDTLDEIRSEIGQRQPLALLVGQDAVNQLDTWKEWRRLFDLAHIVVMRRPDSAHEYSPELMAEIETRLVKEAKALWLQPCGRVLPIELTQLAISSTDIRQRLQAGKSCRFLLPAAVIDYIREHGLYTDAHT
ncbi:MAG TPA: nicotinate-nucleotide adenylyltransferase [Xanthomonadales bacterium]|nr:nicotinate-nucleotide adenylyltransferase [Xanthomonadales bacterium]